MESQQGNTPHHGGLPAGVTPDHLWTCLSQRAEVVMWNRMCVCVCCEYCFPLRLQGFIDFIAYIVMQRFKLRTKIVSLVHADPVN